MRSLSCYGDLKTDYFLFEGEDRSIRRAVAPKGMTRLDEWLNDNAEGLGRQYVSELRPNYQRQSPTADRVWS